MQWIYLSPHLDDVAFSCGGLVRQQIENGATASIWTICAGDPPSGKLSDFAEELHSRWETREDATRSRRLEDILSCKFLGATYRHLPIPDCIYRKANQDYWRDLGEVDGLEISTQPNFLYCTREALFGQVDPGETKLVQDLTDYFVKEIPATAEVVCPLTVGSHVDHRLTRSAAEELRKPLWYYADFPYTLEISGWLEQLETIGWKKYLFKITSDSLLAWQRATEAHQSQISTFWQSAAEMRNELQAYTDTIGGITLWKPPVSCV